jgi:hypothetical protein
LAWPFRREKFTAPMTLRGRAGILPAQQSGFALTVIPAKAGIQAKLFPETRSIGPSLRWGDAV